MGTHLPHPPLPPPTVAIGVRSRRSKASHRAVRWALENEEMMMMHHGVILIHVMPPITSIPTPSGNHIPIMEMDANIVSIYRQDMKSKCDEIFVPFKRMCKTKKIETLVLEDDNPAFALLRYISERGCRALVLGYSSTNCITRRLKGPDVPSNVLKLATDTCNIYLVARHKLITKLTNTSSVPVSSAGQGEFTQTGTTEAVNIIDERTLPYDSLKSKSAKSLEELPGDLSGPSLEAHTYGANHRTLRKESSEFQMDNNGSECTISHEDTNQIELEDELKRGQLELRDILKLYDQVCGDLVHVQKKVQSLSSECLKEAKRASDVHDREEMLKRIFVTENAKYLEAMKEVEASKQVLAKEISERQKAELLAFVESWKKLEMMDALLTSDKRYRKYSRDEIELATDFFSDTNMIGEGGYGKVYRCTLDHIPVAIKVFHEDTFDTKQEFLKEVEILSQLRHPYLVLLLAACPEIGCLVYEYMENGSLEERLRCMNGTPPLPWVVRFRIAFEVASALAFLHSSKPEPIVHRDLKPGNILLDRNYVSKIADVGLAKLMSDIVPDNVTEYRNSVLAGTLYYMDPEYQRTGTIRPKSDVYAFGVIVLQLLTGRHPKGLILEVENAINSGCFSNVLDKSILDWPLAESQELAYVALKCTKLQCRDRPDLEYEILPLLKRLQNTSHGFQLQKDSIYVPNHYFCPILQEIMDDPYIAADGYTYECGAIKAWLDKHNVSPVTKAKFLHTVLTPNNTLRSSIQEWRQRTTGSSS